MVILVRRNSTSPSVCVHSKNGLMKRCGARFTYAHNNVATKCKTKRIFFSEFHRCTQYEEPMFGCKKLEQSMVTQKLWKKENDRKK